MRRRRPLGVRIIDAQTGDPLDQVPFEHVSDGHWIDDDHNAVGTGQTGTWGLITLAFDEVVEHAAGQLSCGFTDEECYIYRIEQCPTLGEISSGSV